MALPARRLALVAAAGLAAARFLPEVLVGVPAGRHLSLRPG